MRELHDLGGRHRPSPYCLGAGLFVAVALVGVPAAHAQHHHEHAGGDDTDHSGEHAAPATVRLNVHAGVHVEVGTVEAFSGDRDYQGLVFMAGARRGAFELGAHLPLYRIDLGGDTATGLGDVHVMARYVALSRHSLQLGASAGVMPPIGDDDDGLGMGHWMVMTGGFVRTSRGPVSGQLTLGYAGVLGGGGHAEHGVDVWPPVSPMNAHELRATATATMELWRDLGGSLAVLGATPLGDGAFIASVGGELSYPLGRLMVGAGARHGLASHTAGLVISSSVMGEF